MIRLSTLVFLLLLISPLSIFSQWVKQTVNTTASFRGLSVVNEKVVWASGTDGTVIKTIDGGKTWKVMTVPGAEKLDFRDIEAFDANTAYILSIGNGESSRIYKTIDGGTSWKEQFRNKNEKAFFDAIACWDNNNCIAVSDPVDNKFLFVRTSDGGSTWPVINPPSLKAKVIDLPVGASSVQELRVIENMHGRPIWLDALAAPGEAAFAASGTCLITRYKNGVMLVTGGTVAAVLVSGERGDSWIGGPTPINAVTPGEGIFSIAMADKQYGAVVGGNYEKPDATENNLAFTQDGGQTWILGTGLLGYRSGVAYVNRKTIIAVGTNGSDITKDGGKIWYSLGRENLNAVQSKGKRATWAVGPKGMVVKMK